MREQPRYLMNAQVLFSRELVLREALLDRRSIVRSGRHGSGWAINSLRPEGSLLGIQNSRDPSLWVIQMDAHDWGVFGSETGTNTLDSWWIRPRLSRAISRIVLKMTMELSGRTCERSTLTTPLNGTLGMGVTKISWAAAAGVAIATARRTNQEKAGKQDGKRIRAHQRRSEPKEYPDCPGLARNMGTHTSGLCSHISYRHRTHKHRIVQSLGESSATRKLY
jgi:hypothetical protein